MLQEYCTYNPYVAFLICNGLAFLFSVGAVGMVVAVPWLYPQRQTYKHHRSINCWIFCGLLLLLLALVAFTGAFVYAGLVTGVYGAPDPTCGILPCNKGGKLCKPDGPDDSMDSLLSLNGVHGECFVVTAVANGSTLISGLRAKGLNPALLLQYNSSSQSAYVPGSFDLSACYLAITGVERFVASKYTYNSRDVLCTAGVIPGNTQLDKTAAGRVPFYDVLANATIEGGFWVSPTKEREPVTYYMMIDAYRNCSLDPSVAGCVCSQHMAENQGELMFVTYAPAGLEPQIYIAEANHAVEPVQDYGLSMTEIRSKAGLGQNLTLFAPPIFLRSVVAVYDELPIRCSSLYNAPEPTLCSHGPKARQNAPKWYALDAASGEFRRQCGPFSGRHINGSVLPWDASAGAPMSEEEQTARCSDSDAYAVDDKGQYILISQLAELGSEVLYDHKWLDELGRENNMLAFVVMGLAAALYVVIGVCLLVVRYNVRAETDDIHLKSFISHLWTSPLEWLGAHTLHHHHHDSPIPAPATAPAPATHPVAPAHAVAQP